MKDETKAFWILVLFTILGCIAAGVQVMDWLHPDNTEFWSFIIIPIFLGIICFSLKIALDK